MFSASLWIGSEELEPWGICELSDAQKDIFRFKDEDGEWEWLPWGMATKDFTSEKRYNDLGNSLEGRTSITYPSGFLLPLSMWQVDRIRAACISGWDMETRRLSKTLVLDQVKFLTAPQLKTLLLFRPDIAEHLLKELEK